MEKTSRRNFQIPVLYTHPCLGCLYRKYIHELYFVIVGVLCAAAVTSPRFTSRPQQLGVLEGGHVTLRCAVIGLGE